MKRFLLVLVFSFSGLYAAKTADCIVFSYNRPLLLELFLRSFHENITGCESLSIVYRASSSAYQEGYAELEKEYSHVRFIQQSEQAEADFKALTVHTLRTGSTADYIIFAVDDNVVKDEVSFSDMAHLLEKYNAYGFYLRLGTHLTYCYSEDRAVPLPNNFVCIEPGVYSWQFSDGICDWFYPHSVDMTLYRKADIAAYLTQMHYTNPNTLEAYWAVYGARAPVSRYKGLCYETTKVINIPLNCVQTTYKNRAMELYSSQEMLDIFVKGLRIDNRPLYRIKNSAPHIEYCPTFM